MEARAVVCGKVIESGGERGRRALSWIALASVGLLAAAIVYLRSSPTSPPAAQPVRRAAAQQAGPPVFFNVSFGDAKHGVVQVYRQGSQLNPTPPIYLTSDGGRTWRPLAQRPVAIAAVTYVDEQR